MAAINSRKQSFFPETYAWTMYHAKPSKNVSEMDYGSKESWNITRDQENKSLQILRPNFEIFWLKNCPNSRSHIVKCISFWLSEFFTCSSLTRMIGIFAWWKQLNLCQFMLVVSVLNIFSKWG